MEFLAGSGDFGQDVGGFGGPHQGAGSMVVTGDISFNRLDWVLNAVKDTPAQALAGDPRERSAPPC